jgi:excisionase family DNA binding protein
VSGRLLTAREVADRFGLTVETILRWHRAGKLPGYRLADGRGGRGPVRFDEDVCDAWLDARKTGATHREGESQPDGRARREGYVPLLSPVRANPPHDAATTEKET